MLAEDALGKVVMYCTMQRIIGLNLDYFSINNLTGILFLNRICSLVE
jgi:hypothetical protein